MKFGSLFTGIGGLDLGLERAGLTCEWQVEIDDYCQKVLSKHWPEVYRHKDITTFNAPSYVDLVAAGFPCQDISYAGKGAGIHGERSGLFFEAIRVIREVGPRFVLLENVAALLSRGMGDVLGTLASIGFDAEWHCIPAASVGAPHIRDRVFIVGEANSHPYRNGWQKGGGNDGGETQAGEACRSDAKRLRSHLANTESKRLQGQRTTKQQERPTRLQEEELKRFRDSVGASQWATEPRLGRVANGVPRRVDRLRGLGNAVVPQLAEFIGQQILASMKVAQ